MTNPPPNANAVSPSSTPREPEPSITRELVEPPIAGPALDPDLFKPNEVEKDFLHKWVSNDDAELEKRVNWVQQAGYRTYEYPCIRGFHFVSLKMLENPIYQEVLEIGRQAKENGDPALLMDLGCCTGTDLRKLIDDGYPGHLLLGADLRPAYIQLGYELFADSPQTCPITFITADIFDMALEPRISPLPALSLGENPLPMQLSGGLEDLRGRLSVIYAGAFFHLFNEDTQFAIALRLLLLLLRPFTSTLLGASSSATPKKRRKAIIFGRHQSQAEAGMIPDWMGRERYAHSPSTLPGMWAKAFDYLEKNYGIEKPGEGRVQVRSFLTGHLHGIPGDSVYMIVWSVTVEYDE